jgi:[acyl-carrier-protein] S-malonyltransferase
MSGFAFVFSGQGGQSPENTAQILSSPAGAAILDLTRDILPPEISHKPLSPEIVFGNRTAQPLVCVCQLAIWETLKTELPGPEIFAGFSLGWLSACGAAGVFSVRDTVALAVKRGALMSAAAARPQTMAAVTGLNRKALDAILAASDAEAAIISGERHFTCGMEADKYPVFEAECKKAGAQRVVRLPVTVASHSSFMRGAAADFRLFLEKTPASEPSVPLIAGRNAVSIIRAREAKDELAAQIDSPLDWQSCMEAVVSSGCGVILESGPGDTLSKMFCVPNPGVTARSVSEFHSISAATAWARAALSRLA